MSDITQQNRWLAVATALGGDTLLLTHLRVTEQFSRLPVIELTLMSTEATVDFDSLLGTNLTVRMDLPAQKTRYFNGYFSGFSQTSTVAGYTTFHATVVPWLWFLTRTSNCRIFQDQKTVPDIIKKVFSDHGFSDIEDRLGGPFRQREYTVQYRETDFNFVCRLMEDEGIYWFFTHDDGIHKLVLCDSPSKHNPFPGFASIPYNSNASGATSMNGIHFWSMSREVQPGVYAMTDFDFETPRKNLTLNDRSAAEHANADFEIFDYPGGYTQVADGTSLAKVRIGEWVAQHEVFNGRTDVRGVACGCKFTLTDPPFPGQDGDYVILGMTCSAANDAFSAGGSAGDEFDCSFTAMKADKQFRPPRHTPKPVIQGPQTAIVVGKDGEEIWTDKYGRVILQFQWDRYSNADEKSSCWVRVAQIWAGNKWGGMFIPRIGQEVIVEFLEGDPDRPIVTGRVYNGDAMPPYTLSDNATRSGIKTLSSKGGDGFNELRFEDKKGSEQVFIHAEKDMDVRVKNDSKEWIGNDRHLVVTNMQIEHVEVDRHETIDRDHQEHIGRDRHTTIDGKEARKVGGTFSATVTGDVTEVFNANHSEQVSQNLYLKAMGIVIEADTGITLKVGGNSVVIDPSGVSVTGSLVTIAGDMTMINSGPGSPPDSGVAGVAVNPALPRTAKEADDADTGEKNEAAARSAEIGTGETGSTSVGPEGEESAPEESGAGSGGSGSGAAGGGAGGAAAVAAAGAATTSASGAAPIVPAKGSGASQAAKCKLSSITAACQHSGRHVQASQNPPPDGQDQPDCLEIVPGSAQASDKIQLTADIQSPCSDHALWTIPGRSPRTGKKTDFPASPLLLHKPSWGLKSFGLWLLDQQPNEYGIECSACDGGPLSLSVKAYPNDEFSLEFDSQELAQKYKWVKTGAEKIKSLLNLNKFEVNILQGKVSASACWKEDPKGPRAFYFYKITGSFDPFLGGEGKFPMVGIPIVEALRRILEFGEYIGKIADAILKADVYLKVSGGLGFEFSFERTVRSAPDYPPPVSSKGFTGRFSLTIGAELQIFKSPGDNGDDDKSFLGVEIALEGELSLKGYPSLTAAGLSIKEFSGEVNIKGSATLSICWGYIKAKKEVVLLDKETIWETAERFLHRFGASDASGAAE